LNGSKASRHRGNYRRDPKQSSSTVVEWRIVPGVAEEGYSVEFFDATGNAVSLATLPATTLRMPTPADRPAARALSA